MFLRLTFIITSLQGQMYENSHWGMKGILTGNLDIGDMIFYNKSTISNLKGGNHFEKS